MLALFPFIFLYMLPATLKSSARPVYLLSSDEPLLVREWLDAARKSLKESGFEEFVSHQVESGFDWNGLLEDCQSLSLFCEKKCHVIRFASNKPGQVGAKFIGQICELQLQDIVFILVMPKLDMASKNSAWMKKVIKIGEAVELKPVYANELAGWVSQRALSKGISLDHQAAMYLADLTEGNLLATDQELEKLALAFEPNAALSLQQINESISRSSRYTHYLLVDACLAGQSRRAVKILQGLQQEGFQPIQIQYAVQNAIETLLQLKLAQQNNRLNASTWQSLRIWQSKQRLYSSALSRLSYLQIERFLQSCATLDRINKGQQQPLYVDADWIALKQLVSSFCVITEVRN